MRTAVAMSVSLILLMACSDPLVVERDQDAPIQTDRLRYDVVSGGSGWRAQIVWTFTNPIAEPVSVVNCRGSAPTKLQKLESDEWINAWSPAFLLCLSPPIVVAAGATYADTLHFFAGYPGSNAGPKLEVQEIEGVYRLVWWPLLNYDHDDVTGDLLPLEQRASNAFRFEN